MRRAEWMNHHVQDTMNTVIETDHLVKCYGDVTAVDAVSLTRAA
jgi:hypothetical protein